MDAKQERKALQESIQLASQIRKSEYTFSCALLQECMGCEKTLLKCLDIIHKKPNPKNINPPPDIKHVSKLLLSANNDNLIGLLYIPKTTIQSKIDFMRQVKIDKYDPEFFLCYNSGTFEEMDQASKHLENLVTDFILFKIRNNPDKNIYVFKLKDDLISQSIIHLRAIGILPKVEEDDDELFGEEIFDTV